MEKFKNTYYLYLTRQIQTAVIESQVLNWLEVLQSKGVCFDLMFDNNVFDLFRQSNLQKVTAIQKEFELRLKRRIHYTWAVRRFKLGDFISNLIKAFAVIHLILISKVSRKTNKAIIQTRYMSDFYTLRIVKKIIPNVLVIFDARGDVPMEYLNSHGFDCISEVNNPKINSYFLKLINEQRQMCQMADKIFCVSDAFKRRLLDQFDFLESSKIEVIHGGADDSLFYFDVEKRIELRKKLGLDDQIIFVYSGRLLHHWHKRDLIFEFISMIQRKFNNTFFLCITPDESLANSMREEYKIDREKVQIMYLRNGEIGDYLNASDIGIIFRDNIGTNRVSCPTKIAEYLLTGLPILISDNVGDYSNFVKTFKYGSIIHADGTIKYEDLDLKEFISMNRTEISNHARLLFSKQALLEKIIYEYEKLVL